MRERKIYRHLLWGQHCPWPICTTNYKCLIYCNPFFTCYGQDGYLYTSLMICSMRSDGAKGSRFTFFHWQIQRYHFRSFYYFPLWSCPSVDNIKIGVVHLYLCHVIETILAFQQYQQWEPLRSTSCFDGKTANLDAFHLKSVGYESLIGAVSQSTT